MSKTKAKKVLYWTDVDLDGNPYERTIQVLKQDTIIRRLKKLEKRGTLEVVLGCRDGFPCPCYGGLDKDRFCADLMDMSLRGWVIVDVGCPKRSSPWIRVVLPDEECNWNSTNITAEVIDELLSFLTSATHEYVEWGG